MASDSPTESHSPRLTAMHNIHVELGARMVDFAGWDMPIQYEGVIAEHNWCRSSAGLFDVGHMAALVLESPTGFDQAAAAMETLSPAPVATVASGRQRYGVLTNNTGGIIDDLIFTNRGDDLMMVVNAGRRDVVVPHLQAKLPEIDPALKLVELNVGLLALQGPQAATVLDRMCDEFRLSGAEPFVPSAMAFLDFAQIGLGPAGPLGADAGPTTVGISRSGYTGEDGFELVLEMSAVEPVSRWLLDQPEVQPAGLGARDTLRLEAGLPLYGNDLTESITPIEAGLTWTIPKRRREDGLFPGADVILAQHAEGPARRRVGLSADGRRPVRDGSVLFASDGSEVGVVTSGGYGPTVEAPVAMGYVATELAEPGTSLEADVRGKRMGVTITALPFVPHRYHRGSN